MSQPGTDRKEKSLPLTPQALGGTWGLWSGDNAVAVKFGPRSVIISARGRCPEGVTAKRVLVEYDIGAGARTVNIGKVAVGRLVSTSELRLSFRQEFLWLPKGAVVTLGKRMPDDAP